MAMSPHSTSPAGIALIKAHEGVRLKAYQDPVGIWTIGYGHTGKAPDGLPLRRGLTIDQAQAEALLRADLKTAEAAVTRLVQVPLSQHQFDALVSFTLNLGDGALARSTLLKRLNAADYLGAAAQFGRWTRGSGRILRGLVNRRAAERALFLTPEPSAGKPAPTH